MRTLKYCNVDITLDEDMKRFNVTVDNIELVTTSMDMLLDTLSIWNKLGYISLTGDANKLTDIDTGVTLDIINNPA